MDEYQMKMKYVSLGGHTHISIWTGKQGKQLGKSGDICMTNEEFEAWKNGSIVTAFVPFPEKTAK